MPLASLLLTACATAPHDDDGDLLLSDVEVELGTNPDLPDSDGDGLLDGHEVHFHLTDPTKGDSDGDGDNDGWEIEFGLDPLDATSHRYPNEWPHLSLAAKAELRRTAAPVEATVGERVRDVTLTDADGNQVELYDLAMQGRPVLLIEGGSRIVGSITSWFYDRSRGPFLEFDIPEDVADAPHDGKLIVLYAWAESFLGDPVTLQEVGGRLDDGPLPPNLLLLADPAFATWVHLGRRDLGVDDPSRRADTFHFAILDDHMIVRGVNDWAAVQQLITP